VYSALKHFSKNAPHLQESESVLKKTQGSGARSQKIERKGTV